jgi:hypothetical protein
MNATAMATAIRPTANTLDNPAAWPNFSTTTPDIDVLSEAPTPETAPTRPWARLNRPVPLVRSAITSAQYA